MVGPSYRVAVRGPVGEVAKVRVNTHDGRQIGATMGKDGWLVAWWPGTSDVNTVTLFDQAGAELGTEPGGIR